MAKVIKVWDGSQWQPVGTALEMNALTADSAQTLTNKTISGGSNNLTNIANSSLVNSSITINGTPISLGGSVNVSAAPIAQAVSSNITMQANYNYFVNTTAARSLTLPASPELGDEISIYDASGTAGTYNITVLRNGNLINGSSDNFIIDVNGGAVSLIYTGSTYGWKVG